MVRRFYFAKAFWFRWPLRALVVAVTVFALLSLYPARLNGTANDHERAAFGFAVLGAFVVLATLVSVAIDESYVDDTAVTVRFEAFFGMHIPLTDMAAVRRIDPRPRWRYRWGLSTDWDRRIACSHGGAIVEIEVLRPLEVQLWPRRVAVTRLWLAVAEPDAFIAMLHHAVVFPPTREMRGAA